MAPVLIPEAQVFILSGHYIVYKIIAMTVLSLAE